MVYARFASVLDLDAGRIRHGEVWRLFPSIFIPQTLSPWWILSGFCGGLATVSNWRGGISADALFWSA
jgi:hypothetical protein